ncbi:MAG: enoyl-CoA hydratase [Pseudomonadota bacterium]
MSASTTAYENIQVETDGAVGIIRLNRPKAYNALNAVMVAEVGQALLAFEADETVGCMVLTGSEKAFAAGADIKEMADKSFADVQREDFITDDWEVITHCRKPVIAAVAGFALGGGCEFALMCDMIIAADTAQFGQPEVTIGTIPGAGGTQRLTRSVGKSMAMYMCLTGDRIDAQTALQAGLVAKVVPADELMDETLKVAQKIAGLSQPVVATCKEAVKVAYETTLSEGVRFERRAFHSTFALEDRSEGMQAFTEKRKPDWKNR